MEIFEEFQKYCIDLGGKSSKVKSYPVAIKYLCEFLNVDPTSAGLKEKIIAIEPDIRNKQSKFYASLFRFLKARGQSSYLVSGFIGAAIPPFLSFLANRKASKKFTKVDAISAVIKECNGHASLDDIYAKSPKYYENIDKPAEWKAAIRGTLYREIYNNRSFKRNLDGSFSLIDDQTKYPLPDEGKDDGIIFDALKDAQIDASFDRDKTIGILPIGENAEHKYTISKTSGTAVNSLRKVYSGRKAEKYFMDFLKDNGFVQDKDYFDVANKKSEGFDVKLFGFGLEIKNIKSGSFFLSDNEIALLENQKTDLVLVDIDNGIWLVRNSSPWLKNVTLNIKEIRRYCSATFPNLDLADIKIVIDKGIEQDAIELSQLSQQKLRGILTPQGL